MVYLDNSASTIIKPKEVLKAVNDSLLNYTANPGRSGHKASIKTALKITEVRQILSQHYNNGNIDRIIFTQNCTQALNMAIIGCKKSGGHIVCTENEHNSVLRPLQYLSDKESVDYSIAFQSNNKGITLEDIKREIKSNTYMVICNHISNVNAALAEISPIGKYCREHNLIFLVDCAQSCGHVKIDMKKDNIDFLTIAGHKGFYSPQSIGALIMNEKFTPNPIMFGGTGTNSLELVQPEFLPERLEVGTISAPLIIGLGAGINFVEKNFQEIQNKIDDLTTYLNFELNKLNINCYTQPENSFGVIAFNITNIDSNEIANILNEKYDIYVRGGYHCSPIKHKALGTIGQGAVRVSISYFNTFSDIQKLLYALKHIIKDKKLY